MLRMVDGADNITTALVSQKYGGRGLFDQTWGFRVNPGGAPTPRSGTGCYWVQSSDGIWVPAPNVATGIMGAAWHGGGYNATRWVFAEGGLSHILIRANNDGSISIVRGNHGGTVLATSAAAVVSAGWNYYEAKATIHDTTGYVEVRKNGVVVVSYTGDTRNGGSGYINQLFAGGGYAFGGPNENGVGWDDMYFADDVSGEITDFIGDCKIETLRPTAEGAASDFTPSAGTNNALNVDDATSDSDTTYNASNTVGHIDSLVMENLATLAGEVKGVQVYTVMRKDDAGLRSARARILSNGSEGDGATRALGDSYNGYVDVFEQNPDGSVDWSIAAVNALEAGYEVVS